MKFVHSHEVHSTSPRRSHRHRVGRWGDSAPRVRAAPRRNTAAGSRSICPTNESSGSQSSETASWDAVSTSVSTLAHDSRRVIFVDTRVVDLATFVPPRRRRRRWCWPSPVRITRLRVALLDRGIHVVSVGDHVDDVAAMIDEADRADVERLHPDRRRRTCHPASPASSPGTSPASSTRSTRSTSQSTAPPVRRAHVSTTEHWPARRVAFDDGAFDDRACRDRP